MISNKLIQLGDYYHILGPWTFGAFLLFFFLMDILGFAFRTRVLLARNPELRLLDWLLGLGLYVLFWFLLGFFIPPKSLPVLLSIVFLSGPLMPYYWKSRALPSLWNELKPCKFLFLVLIPFLPGALIRISLPPYYIDEVYYHFISIIDLNHLSTWKYTGNVYNMIPKIMEIFFILTFSVTKTYVVARMIHLLIPFTMLFFSIRVLTRLFDKTVAMIFVLTFLSLSTDMILNGSSGQVDVTNYSFNFLAILFGYAFLRFRQLEDLHYSVIFWGMTIGTKYSGLSSLASFLAVFVGYMVYRRELFFPLLKFRHLMKSAVLLLSFGGYWYLKNLILTGNPTFPFIFACHRWASSCDSNGGKYFAHWTQAVTPSNFYPILIQLFSFQKWILPIFLVSLLALVFLKKSRMRASASFFLALVAIEFLLLARSSGFYFRYHQHIQLILVLFIAIMTGQLISLAKSQANRKKLITCLGLFLAYGFAKHVKRTYICEQSITRADVKYALGQEDIHDYLRETRPETYPMIEWCEHPPEGKNVPLENYDPDVDRIGALMSPNPFLTNCQYARSAFPDNLDSSRVLDEARKQKLKFYFASTNPCLPREKVVIKVPGYEDAKALNLRKITNELVCHSQVRVPGYIYFFDSEKL